MNKQVKFFMLAGLVALAGCSKDNNVETSTNETLDLQANVHVTQQKAIAKFDTSAKGLYRAIFANLSAIGGGALDINLGNNAEYTASLELTNGTIVDYTLSERPSSIREYGKYDFVGPNSHFTIDVTNPNNPIITNSFLNGQEYGTYVSKKTTRLAPAVVIGTFSPNNPAVANLEGNFTIMADTNGPIMNVMVTNNTGFPSVSDATNEDFTDCANMTSTTPNFFLNSESIIFNLADQTSNFYNGTGFSTEWSLFYFNLNNGSNIGYRDNDPVDCNNNATSGTFTWTDANESHEGTILVVSFM